MATQFHKPRDALRRAAELVKVGNKLKAVKLMLGPIEKRRWKGFSEQLEEFILYFLELVVSLRNPSHIYEAILYFRTCTQSTGGASLRKVVTKLLDKVEANVAEAASESKKQAGEVDDVETEDMSPEELIMLSVSPEDSNDRKDRENFIPWLRFATEAFRKVLDALRNRMEDLYHDVVRREFEFMQRYNRTSEFRRMCQHQRKHFKDHIEHRKPRMDGSAPKDYLAVESLERHMETRFHQLETCKALNMWNEAFRTIKDMERVLIEYRDLDPRYNSVLAPEPEVMARYYESCALVAWMSDNRLYHAQALLNMHITLVDNEVFETDEDIEKSATRLLVSALAIPLVRPEEASTTGLGTSFGVEVQTQKMREWSSLLGITNKVTRETVLEEVLDAGAKEDASSYAQRLYELLEEDFCPLVLVKRVVGLLSEVDAVEELKMYTKAIKELTLQRMLQQLERVYRCMHLSQFYDLIAPLEMPQHEVEMLVVRAIKDRLVQARFDYKGAKLHLGMDELESDTLRSQLKTLAGRLRSAVNRVVAAPMLSSGDRDNLMEEARRAIKATPILVADRKIEIERRKEQLEREKEWEEKKRKQAIEEKERQQKEKEMMRIRTEAMKRQAELARKEEEARIKKQKELILRVHGMTQKDLGIEDLKEVGATQLQEEVARKKKAQEEAEAAKRDKHVKRFTHVLRVYREVERPAILASQSVKEQEDNEAYEKTVEDLTNYWKASHENCVELRDRLAPVVPYAMAKQSSILNARMEEAEARHKQMWEQKQKEWQLAQFIKARQELPRITEMERQQAEREEAERLQREQQEEEMMARWGEDMGGETMIEKARRIEDMSDWRRGGPSEPESGPEPEAREPRGPRVDVDKVDSWKRGGGGGGAEPSDSFQRGGPRGGEPSDSFQRGGPRGGEPSDSFQRGGPRGGEPSDSFQRGGPRGGSRGPRDGGDKFSRFSRDAPRGDDKPGDKTDEGGRWRQSLNKP